MQPDAPRIGGITPFLRFATLASHAGLGAPAVLSSTDDVVEFGVLPGHTLHDLAARAPEIQVALAVADTYVYSRHQVGEQARRDAVASLDRYTSELVAARRGQTSAPG